MKSTSRPAKSVIPCFPGIIGYVMLLLVSGCGLAMDNEDRLDRAEKAYAEGEYRAAIIDTKNVLRDEPDNVRGRLLLGRASVELGDGVSAEKELRRAIGLGVERAEVQADLGRALLLQRKFDQVISEITVESTGTEVDRLVILQLRGDALVGLDEPAAARDLYTEILAADSDNIEALLGIVNSYVTEKNYSQARETINQILSDHNKNVAVWATSGSLYFRARSFEAAERDYQSALQLAVKQSDKPNEILAWNGLAETHLAQDNLIAAKEATNRLLVLAPDAIQTKYFDARIAYMEKDFSRAQQQLQQVLRVVPEHRPSQMLLGALHLYNGDLGQAEMYLSAVVAAVPSNPGARKLLAETHLQLNRVEEAQDVLKPILGGNVADASTYGIAARASMKDGNADEAVEYLQRAVAANPENSDVALGLAEAYLAAGRNDEARNALEGIADTSDLASFRRELLEIFVDLQRNETASALSNAEDLLSRRPEDLRLLSLVGSINLSLGENQTAREYFRRAHSLDPEDITSRLNLARVDIAESDFVSARAHYDAVLEMRPNDARPMVALARISVSEGKREEAEKWLERARRADANAVTPRMILSRLYIGRREFGLAETVAEEAIKVHDSFAELHNLLGLARRGQRKHEESVRDFKRATEIEPSNPDFQLNLARAYISTGNKGLARQLLRTSIDQHPGHVSTGVLLAALTAQMGDHEEAMDLARELQQQAPDSGLPYVLEGELLAGKKLYGDAVDAYDAALKRNNDRTSAVRAFRLRVMAGSGDPYAPLLNYLSKRPADHEVQLVLAQGYDKGGKNSEAIATYESILKSSSENLIALNNLAWLYMTEGDGRAEKLARQAHELAPDNGTVADTLGWILVEKGNLHEGVELLKKAVVLENGRAEIRYHLSVGLVGLGETAEAKSILLEILAKEDDFTSRRAAEALLSTL